MVRYRTTLMRTILALLLCSATILLCFPVHSVESSFSEGYSSAIFYRRLTNVQLTGDPRTDIVNVAMSQIGYTEGNSKQEYSGLYSGNKNYTEYGLWYEGLQDQPGGFNRSAWCASFVSWCANHANISSNVVTYHAYTPTGYSWFKNNAKAYSRSQVADGAYAPQPGDIVYFKSNWNNNIVNHVGIVVRYEDGILYTVEGNTNSGEETSDGGSVCLKSYNISNTFIRYICVPNYK